MLETSCILYVFKNMENLQYDINITNQPYCFFSRPKNVQHLYINKMCSQK